MGNFFSTLIKPRPKKPTEWQTKFDMHCNMQGTMKMDRDDASLWVECTGNLDSVLASIRNLQRLCVEQEWYIRRGQVNEKLRIAMVYAMLALSTEYRAFFKKHKINPKYNKRCTEILRKSYFRIYDMKGTLADLKDVYSRTKLHNMYILDVMLKDHTRAVNKLMELYPQATIMKS